MKLEKTCKLQKQTTEGSVSMTLPKQFCQACGFKPGDIVTVTLDSERENTLIITKN